MTNLSKFIFRPLATLLLAATFLCASASFVQATIPTVTRVVPNDGPVSGGTNITLTGASFEKSGAYAIQSILSTANTNTPRRIFIDSSGNIYIVASFDGTTVIGSDTLTTAGSNDTFVAKFDPSGTPIWARRGGGTGNDVPNDGYLDSGGNLFITGSFGGTGTWGSSSLVSAGSNDTFLIKYDSNGTVTMALRGGSTGIDVAQGLTLDSGGNIYLTGQFSGTATWDSSSLVSAGGTDAFVIRYNSSGSVTLAQRGGSTGSDSGTRIIVDSSGNMYATGTYAATATFGSFTLSNAGGNDIFTVKFGSDGTALWAEEGSSTGTDVVGGIAFDTGGNVFIVGSYPAAITFGSQTLSNQGGSDPYIVKYGTDGTVLQAWTTGSTNTDTFTDILFDSSGNFYVAGNFQTSSTFGSTTVSGTGFEAYILKYDSSGNILWVESGGGSGTDLARHIVRDSSGSLYLLGTYSGTTATFDNVTTSTSSTSQASFIVRYSETIKVALGDVDCSNVTFISSTELRCTTRASSAGTVTVTIYNPTLQSASLAQGFRYFLPNVFSAPALPGACTTSPPSGQPSLFQVKTTSRGITVWFTPVGFPHDHYLVEYGPEDDEERYSERLDYNDYSGVITTTLRELLPNTLYYLKVRGGNNCAAGTWSNVFPAKTTKRPTTRYLYKLSK